MLWALEAEGALDHGSPGPTECGIPKSWVGACLLRRKRL